MLYFLLGFAAGIACTRFYQVTAAVSEGCPIRAMMKVVTDQVLLRAEQLLRRSVVPVDKNGKLYKISYVIHGKLYEIEVRPVMGPLAASYTPGMRGKMSLLQ